MEGKDRRRGRKGGSEPASSDSPAAGGDHARQLRSGRAVTIVIIGARGKERKRKIVAQGLGLAEDGNGVEVAERSGDLDGTKTTMSK